MTKASAVFNIKLDLDVNNFRFDLVNTKIKILFSSDYDSIFRFMV